MQATLSKQDQLSTCRLVDPLKGGATKVDKGRLCSTSTKSTEVDRSRQGRQRGEGGFFLHGVTTRKCSECTTS